MKITLYILLAAYLYWSAAACLYAFVKNGDQKTGTMPDNDILVGWIFGKKNISRVNNLKGAIILLISAILVTVLIVRGEL